MAVGRFENLSVRLFTRLETFHCPIADQPSHFSSGG